MQVFQSWADIVIMLVLAIAYVITFIAQRNQINALNGTIEALKKTNEESVKLTSAQSDHIRTYKEMININDISQYIEMQVGLKVNESLDIISKNVTDQLINDNFWENVANHITEDLRRMHASNFIFIIYIIKKNNLSNEKIKIMVDTFFPNHLWIYDVILEKLPEFDHIKPNRVSEPERQIDQSQDSIP